jgi:hypothetical protein
MKEMIKKISIESDEYECMSDALSSIKRVADYINEMQKISDSYTPIFQQMCDDNVEVDHVDVSVDNLLHYGQVIWLNYVDKNQISSWFTRQDDAKTSECDLMVFVYKRCVVLVAYESQQKKVAAKSVEDLKFSTLIPISNLLLRDHAWSDNDSGNQVWEIVDDSGKQDGEEEIVYEFQNRTSEEKKVFVNAVKESKKLNKISNSTGVLGGAGMLPRGANSLRNSISRSTPHSTSGQSESLKPKPSILPKPKQSTKRNSLLRKSNDGEDSTSPAKSPPPKPPPQTQKPPSPSPGRRK